MLPTIPKILSWGIPKNQICLHGNGSFPTLKIFETFLLILHLIVYKINLGEVDMEADALHVEQILAGNEKAFACLVGKYQSDIFALCLAKVRNSQDAEELTQDIFTRAYFKLSQLRDGKKFFAWLKQIAQNECKMYLRQPQKTVITLSDCSKLASTVQVEEQILRQELVKAVMDAIKSLPQKDREVIEAYVSGLSHGEISQMTGLSYRASINRLYRIRKKIMAQVKGLLSGIGVIFKALPLKKILSGGILIMKKKIALVFSIAIIGATGIIVGTSIHQNAIDSHTTLSPPVSVTERSLTTAPKPRHQKILQKEDNGLEVKKEEIRLFLEWLEGLQEQETTEISEETPQIETDNPGQQEKLIRGMTREEILAKIPILVEDIRKILTIGVEVYEILSDPLLESEEGRKELGPDYIEWIHQISPLMGIARDEAEEKIRLYLNYMAWTGQKDTLNRPDEWMYEMLGTLGRSIVTLEPGTPEYEAALEEARRLRESHQSQ